MNALVTGGSRGIGSAISQHLARKGFQVFINYSTNETRAREVQAKILAEGGKAELCQFDVASQTQVDEKFEWIAKTFGPLKVSTGKAAVHFYRPGRMAGSANAFYLRIAGKVTCVPMRNAGHWSEEVNEGPLAVEGIIWGNSTKFTSFYIPPLSSV